jgi:hypothetical protein
MARGRHRGDVNDPALPGARHGFAEHLARQQRARQVRRDHWLQPVDRQIEEGVPRIECRHRHVVAGRVDQHVEPAPLRHDGIPHSFQLQAVQHIGGQGQRLTARGFDGLDQGVGVRVTAAQAPTFVPARASSRAIAPPRTSCPR